MVSLFREIGILCLVFSIFGLVSSSAVEIVFADFSNGSSFSCFMTLSPACTYVSNLKIYQNVKVDVLEHTVCIKCSGYTSYDEIDITFTCAFNISNIIKHPVISAQFYPSESMAILQEPFMHRNSTKDIHDIFFYNLKGIDIEFKWSENFNNEVLGSIYNGFVQIDYSRLDFYRTKRRAT